MKQTFITKEENGYKATGCRNGRKEEQCKKIFIKAVTAQMTAGI